MVLYPEQKGQIKKRTGTQLRNRVGLAIQNMRRDYIEDEQHANQGNPQKFWRNLKTVVPGKTKQT